MVRYLQKKGHGKVVKGLSVMGVVSQEERRGGKAKKIKEMGETCIARLGVLRGSLEVES